MSKARAISPVSSFRLVAAYCNRIAWLATSLLKLGDQHGGLLFHCSWLSILASFFTVAIVSFVFVLVLFFSSHRWLPCQYAISVKLNWWRQRYLDIVLWRQRTISGYWPVTCTICQILHQSVPLNLYGIMTQSLSSYDHFDVYWLLLNCL